MADLFRTIESPSEGLYKEKGSKFMAFAYSIDSEEAIKEKSIEFPGLNLEIIEVKDGIPSNTYSG